MKKFTYAILIALCALCSTINAQIVEQVADINPSGDSYPGQFTVMNNKLYFFADDGIHGTELWVCDSVGTNLHIVKDINPGAADAGLSDLTLMNNKLYFQAMDKLWTSDGTEAGTQLFKDINPLGSDGIDYITTSGSNFFFQATDGMNGYELWVSDGTTIGTHMIKNINPSGHSWPSNLTNMNNKLYFQADDGVHDSELWVSDGDSSGTHLVKNINPNDASNVYYPHVLNNKLYFGATDNVHGNELWVSNGDSLGTHMVKDIRISPSSLSSSPDWFTIMNNKLYFNANDGVHGKELWVSDGDSIGTNIVKDIYATGNANPKYLEVMNNKLYFNAYEVNHGEELWVSNGDSSGTHLVKDINSNGNSGSYPYELTTMNNKLYFIAQESLSSNEELFVSDGTEAGTIKLTPSLESDITHFPPHLTFFPFNGKLYFCANYNDNGFELWRVNDTSYHYSISENIKNENIIIYPNPINTSLFIIVEKPTNISISNITGQEIMSFSVQSKSTIDVSNFPKGIYFLRNSQRTFVKKLIKN